MKRADCFSSSDRPADQFSGPVPDERQVIAVRRIRGLLARRPVVVCGAVVQPRASCTALHHGLLHIIIMVTDQPQKVPGCSRRRPYQRRERQQQQQRRQAVVLY